MTVASYPQATYARDSWAIAPIRCGNFTVHPLLWYLTTYPFHSLFTLSQLLSISAHLLSLHSLDPCNYRSSNGRWIRLPSWCSYQFSYNYFDSNLSCRNILHSSRLIFLLVNSVLWYFGRVCSWCVWWHGILGSYSESAVWLIYLSKQLGNPESPTTITK